MTFLFSNHFGPEAKLPYKEKNMSNATKYYFCGQVLAYYNNNFKSLQKI
jgi:hypothetical protein